LSTVLNNMVLQGWGALSVRQYEISGTGRLTLEKQILIQGEPPGGKGDPPVLYHRFNACNKK
jgi:hypothetical protein